LGRELFFEIAVTSWWWGNYVENKNGDFKI